MKYISLPVLTTTLLLTGCAHLSADKNTTVITKPVSAENAELKDLDLIQVQDQLARFVEIIDLLNQVKPAADTDNSAGVPVRISPLAATKDNSDLPDSQRVENVIAAINDNLAKIDTAGGEAETIRQLLEITDQFSGNKNNLFTGMFNIITRDSLQTEKK